MDCRRFLILLPLFVLVSACAKKTSSTVFPENKNSSTSVSCGADLIKNRFLVNWEDGRFTVESAENADSFVKDFVEPNIEKIRYVEFDKVIRKAQSQVITPQVVSDEWGQEMTGATALWAQGIEGHGVKVAIVDAAVDYSHPQIRPRLSANAGEQGLDDHGNDKSSNDIDDDGNGYVDDVYGWDFEGNSADPVTLIDTQNEDTFHGTHVAGIVATDHSKGMVKGMAPKAELIPVNFMDSTGGGSLGNAVKGLEYAVARGARLINASWGGPGCSESLRSALYRLESQGVLILVASGNDGIDFDVAGPSKYVYPSAFNLPGQITVAAIHSSGYMTDFSNRSFKLVHIGAPGSNILSTVPGGYGYMDGTSMATPFVTGAAALLLSVRPTATPAQLRQALLSSVDVIPGQQLKVSTSGRLNVQKALAALKQLIP